MKENGRSLEEQRQALLEQIHASRATYRRMLTGESEEDAVTAHATAHGAMPESGAARHFAVQDPAFPRSMTMRWIMNHPYYTAAAIVGVAWMIPKAIKGTRRVGKKVANRKNGKAAAPYPAPNFAPVPPQHGVHPAGGYPQTIYVQQPSTPQKTGALAGIAAFGGTALTSLITIATMVMRDPAKMQMAMKLFSTASHYMQNRRQPGTTAAAQDNQTPR